MRDPGWMRSSPGRYGVVFGPGGQTIKKMALGFIALLAGLGLAFGAGLRVLEPLGVANAGIFDIIITGLVISAGKEGLNSVLKFLGYKKDKEKQNN